MAGVVFKLCIGGMALAALTATATPAPAQVPARAPAESAADADAPDAFAGITLVRASKKFLVLKDANVRARPETKSARVGRVAKGRRVDVAGRAKGTQWFAVRVDGKPLGFIYGSILTPLLDGRLSAPLAGTIAAKGKPACAYEIHFEGKTKTEGEVLETADYRVAFRCAEATPPLNFLAAMFITEQPYQLNNKEVFQINLDLRDLPGIEADGLSVITMYDVAQGEVRFDSLSAPSDENAEEGEAQKKPETKKTATATVPKKPAASVETALKAAVDLAYEAWPDAVFTALRKRTNS